MQQPKVHREPSSNLFCKGDTTTFRLIDNATKDKDEMAKWTNLNVA